MIYHEKYKHIKKATIKEIRATIKAGLFKVNENERRRLIVLLNNKLCDIYKIPEEDTPQIINADLCETDGFYNQFSNVIGLNNKLSLITFLHEFKHFLQHYNHKTNNEDIARAWSLSAYYKATPRLYERVLIKGLIIHEKIKDADANNTINL